VFPAGTVQLRPAGRKFSKYICAETWEFGIVTAISRMTATKPFILPTIIRDIHVHIYN
jgi:hypothetical protein